ncbi:multiple sugar transport system permease protein [Symbiobacterium terraclitae]|uniref:Multiple sugar transport system permease protein n=1 Tax=Symbiobacterium terraclitae TaxID=557451 RepID=A0ABS4JP52_9FIRM|nr:carbohydrate ABC transporter permease [Symbiobacterium terraclitae]MBP2017300.1 multiple sugar transport system permease protein [Symbiobacterium terraclitae]
MEISSRSVRAVLYVLLIGYALITVGPFLLSVSTALTKTQHVHLLFKNWGLPPEPTLENFKYILKSGDFGRWVFNSVVVAGLGTLAKVFFNSLAGYALARIRFPGRELVFWAILATMMIPAAVILIPQYLILSKLGWLDSYYGLIVPFTVSAFGIFLMRQFFSTIPVELEEAAQIDGLSRFGIFWRVVLPLTKPALAAQIIFNFLGDWNNFLWPNLIARSREMYTLTVGLQTFKNEYYSFWNQVLAGSMFLTIPVIIIYLILNRWFIKGITITGMKG